MIQMPSGDTCRIKQSWSIGKTWFQLLLHLTVWLLTLRIFLIGLFFFPIHGNVWCTTRVDFRSISFFHFHKCNLLWSRWLLLKMYNKTSIKYYSQIFTVSSGLRSLGILFRNCKTSSNSFKMFNEEILMFFC